MTCVASVLVEVERICGASGKSAEIPRGGSGRWHYGVGRMPGEVSH